MSNKTYPRIISDIGGTNARFCLEVKPYVYENIHILSCCDYASIIDAVKYYLTLTNMMGQINSAILAIPNPAHSDEILMANNPWPKFSIKETRQTLIQFGINNLIFINDWHAMALALPLIPNTELIKFNDSNIVNGARPKITVGPGTGLGVATLICHPQTKEYLSATSEGGHSSFTPITEEEQAIYAYASTKYDHISAERFLSGPGIRLIYEALCHINNITFNATITSEEIVKNGTTSNDILCKRSVDIFCEMLGTFTGNFAVMINAFGGVYIGGGIIPQIIDYFMQSGFIERFNAKGRYRGFLEQIPIFVITTQHPAFLGASYALDTYLNKQYIP